MIFYEQPTDRWGRFDFLLLEAYQMLQDEMCPKCDHPVYLCRSSSNDIEFRVRDSFCASERAMKEYEDKENRRKKGGTRATTAEKAAWGRSFYTVPTVAQGAPEGTQLPTRKEYYEELSLLN